MVNRSYVKEDPLTEKGAFKLVETIKQFWEDRGKEIKIWCEPFVDSKVATFNMFQVRSDMINGLPK